MPLRIEEPATNAYNYPLTIRHLLRAGVASGNAHAIVHREVRMSYLDLETRVARLASVLHELGVGPGTTVAVMDWDSHRYLECFLAIPMMGAVLMTVNVRLSPREISYCLDHSGAEVLLFHADFAEIVAGVVPSIVSLRHLLLMDDDQRCEPSVRICGDYEGLVAAAPDTYQFEDFDERALAATFYTTGTTGAPKGVLFTHRQIVLQCLSIAAAFGTQQPYGFGRDDVYMPMTPMFHVLAWCMPFVATMLGMTQVYPGRYDVDALLDLRDRECVSYSHCVPTVLQMLVDAAEARRCDLSGWTIAVGGSALTPTALARAEACGLRVLAGYGMSETCSTALVSRPIDVMADAVPPVLSWAGSPSPLVEVRIVDSEMRDVPHDGEAVGELVLRAPWLTMSYAGDDAASQALWAGGWMHTQDLVTMTPSGHIRIIDRTKDVIKSGGEWISSIQLEDLLVAHPGIREAAVIGIPDDKWGERPAAAIVPADGAKAPTRDEIWDHLQQWISSGEIGRIARPDTVVILPELPRTSVGKIDKKQLRNAMSAGW